MAERFLVVKLADLGDALTVTPALRALRDSFPQARIDVLVTAAGAAALRGLDSVDNVIVFEKSLFDRPRPTPRSIGVLVRLARRLRLARYDRVFLLHHLFTTAGRLKYQALLAATGSSWRGGLAETNPPYLTVSAVDRGYGVYHEADYWLDVVALAGARPVRERRLEIAVDESHRAAADRLLGRDVVPTTQLVAMFPGAGAYSVGRRWAAENYVDLGRRLVATSDSESAPRLEIVVVGSQSEAELTERICQGIGPPARNLAGKTDVKVLAALFERCDAFVGNDGGAMHVAVAAGAPVVAIFGPTNPVSWGPYGGGAWGSERKITGRSIVFWQNLPCAPCQYRGYLPGTPRGCAAHDCLRLTVPAEVAKAVRQLLSERRTLSQSEPRRPLPPGEQRV